MREYTRGYLIMIFNAIHMQAAMRHIPHVLSRNISEHIYNGFCQK